ncbi:MAG: hypothetical protein GYA33_15120 [Thermogutta sp.]|nr:hypothetical protein [Thermogutta sp.]
MKKVLSPGSCAPLFVVGLILAAGGVVWGQETASAPADSETAAVASMPLASAEACPECCPVCGCPRHVHKDALIAGFNCGCRGSYKFPVPPRFTYHWPGMYAQQTMTGYWSPYRYPALKPPPWMHRPAGSREGNWRPLPQPAVPPAAGSPSDVHPEPAPLPGTVGPVPAPMP